MAPRLAMAPAMAAPSIPSKSCKAVPPWSEEQQIVWAACHDSLVGKPHGGAAQAA